MDTVSSAKGARFLFGLMENLEAFSDEQRIVFEILDELADGSPKYSLFRYLEGAILLLRRVEKGFIKAHSKEHLKWLIEKLSHCSPKHQEFYCLAHPFTHEMHFTFHSKKIMSLFLEVSTHYVSQGSIEKALEAYPKQLLIAEGSFFSISIPKDQITHLHFSIYPKRGSLLQGEKQKLVKFFEKYFEEHIKKSTQSLFVPSNRELLMKSFRWIMKDLTKVDPPQVFIDFVKRSNTSVHFSVLICKVQKESEPPLLQQLNHPDIYIEGHSSDQTGALNKEGGIFSLDIPITKESSVIDGRKQATALLKSLIGPFRDVNGGLIEKVEENFHLFSTHMSDSSIDLKNFFYGLHPQEKQAIAPIPLLKSLYRSIKGAQDSKKEICLEELMSNEYLCIAMKVPHPNFEKTARRALFDQFPGIYLYSTPVGEGVIVGCALNGSSRHEDLRTFATNTLRKWKEKKEIKQVLRLCYTEQFTSHDPRIGTEEETSHLHKMLFEGLMCIGPDGTPEYAIAKDVKISSCQRHYRFTLRKSYWSNQMPLTAHDFAHSWRMSLKPDFHSPHSYLFHPIKNAQAVKKGELPPSNLGITVVDDYTLDVELEHPTVFFLELCTHSSFSPICTKIDNENPSWPNGVGKNYICNGPFHLQQVIDKKTTLMKNPFYWKQKEISLEKVTIDETTEEHAREKFNREECDALLFPFSKSQAFDALENEIANKFLGPTEVRYLSFNCQQYPFSNPKLRNCLSLAIDRKQLAPLFSRDAKPHFSPFSPELSQLNICKSDEENLALARKMLNEMYENRELSFKDLEKVKIYSSQRGKEISKEITRQLNERLSLNLSTIIIDGAKLFSLINQGKIQMYIYSWLNRIQDPSYFFQTFSSEKNLINRQFWTNERIQRIIEKTKTAACVNDRRKYFLEGEEILKREKPLVPLVSAPICSLVHKKTEGVIVTPSYLFDIRYAKKI